jgi:hypothetical protein
MIVGKILGTAYASVATRTIGFLELLLGVWVLTGLHSVTCACVQTAAIISMNALEISFAREFLISALGMVILNLAFLALVWNWALFSFKFG